MWFTLYLIIMKKDRVDSFDKNELIFIFLCSLTKLCYFLVIQTLFDPLVLRHLKTSDLGLFLQGAPSNQGKAKTNADRAATTFPNMLCWEHNGAWRHPGHVASRFPER